MDSRLERAARALLDAASRIEAETMCVVPRRLVDALRAALAAQPAQAGPAIGTKARLRCPWRECRHEWDGEIGLHVYCPKCRCSLTINGPEVVSAPAQAGEAVAWAVQSVYGDDIEAVRLTEARAEQYRREIGERDWRVIPLYAYPTTPASAAVGEPVAYGLWDDTIGEWVDISPPTLEEATVEAWRLTGSLGHKYRVVPLRGDVSGSPIYKEPAYDERSEA